MSIAVEKIVVTPEELLAWSDATGIELIDGVLKERTVSSLSSWVGGRIFFKLSLHVEANELGWVFPPDSGIQCFLDAPRTVRKPDVSFVKIDRLKSEEIRDGWLRVVPDLVVEVVSPHDLSYEVEEKIEMFRRAGVPLIWIVIPPTRSVRVIRADGSSSLIGEGDELLGEGVVPGFACRVADLFLPTAPSPAADPVG